MVDISFDNDPEKSDKIAFSKDFEVSKGAHILYTYDDIDKYIDNAVSFISLGLELGQYIVFLDERPRYNLILNRLQEKGYERSQLKSICFASNTDVYSRENVMNTIRIFNNQVVNKKIPVRTWSNVVWNIETICNILENEEKADKIMAKYKTFSLCAYEGKRLTTSLLVKLIKRHPYIMTDTELVDSVLYKKDFYPSIAVQEILEDAISELNRYKKEAFRLEKLEVISHMAASISHEIRNPLTTIRGFLQLLKKKEKYKEDHKFMELMIEELDRASSIISEFLSLGKTYPTELKLQCLNSCIEKILPLMDAKAVESSKQIISQLSKIPELLLDCKEIRQVLLNLIKNALEATPPGSNVNVSTFLDQNDVVLQISDQGQGIPPDVLKKLGTPFVTTKEHGTGLGIATSYSILERHHANIEVETSPSGTTFYIRFAVPS